VPKPRKFPDQFISQQDQLGDPKSCALPMQFSVSFYVTKAGRAIARKPQPLHELFVRRFSNGFP